MVASTRSKSTSGISTRKESNPGPALACAKREPGEPAIEIAAEGNKPRRPILFGERASTHKGKKRCIDGDPAAHGWSTLTIKPCVENNASVATLSRAAGLAAPDTFEAGSDRQHFSG